MALLAVRIARRSVSGELLGNIACTGCGLHAAGTDVCLQQTVRTGHSPMSEAHHITALLTVHAPPRRYQQRKAFKPLPCFLKRSGRRPGGSAPVLPRSRVTGWQG